MKSSLKTEVMETFKRDQFVYKVLLFPQVNVRYVSAESGKGNVDIECDFLSQSLSIVIMHGPIANT